MSLKDRQVTAQKEIAQKNKIPNGKYQVKLMEVEFGQSQKKADMYTLTWKIKKVLELDGELPEGMEKKDLLKKKRKTRYMPGMNWSLVELLDILEMAGANLEDFEEVSEIDDIFEAMEDAGYPTATMNYKHEEDKQYPDIEIVEVSKVLEASVEAEPEDNEDSPEEVEEAEEEEKRSEKRSIRSPGSK